MPAFAGFIGGTYTGRALAADAERAINLYPEKVESPGVTKSELILLSKPGLKSFANLTRQTPDLATISTSGMSVLCTLTDHTGSPGDLVPYASTQIPWGGGWGFLSYNNLLPNSNPTPNPIGFLAADFVDTILSLYLQGNATQTDAQPSTLQVYDIYLDFTWPNGATARFRPQTWQVLTAANNVGSPYPTTGQVLNPANAVDGDQTTYATIESNQWTYPASWSPVLQVTNFQMVSSTGNVPMAAGSGFPAVRALTEINGRAFAIASAGPNNYFYELHADGSTTTYSVGNGTAGSTPLMPGDTRPQMKASETQILILDGGNGYVFDLRANTLSLITSPAFPPGAVKIDYLDGYFVVLESNSQTFAISGLNDGTSWNLLDFGSAEGEPGYIVSMIVDHRQVWFLGNNHGEIYYDSGNANFPLSRLEGAFFEQGCAAIDSVVKIDNSIMWLGRNQDGAGVVWRANGYTPQRVSTHAIEAMIQGYSKIDDATAYAYQDGGHTFYVLHFPTANATLVYDSASGYWHERDYWQNGQYVADLARCHMYAFGKHLVGDWQSGNIYEMSQQYTTDNGQAIRRLRSAPDLSNGGKFVFYSELRLLMQVGVGLDGGVVPGSDPQIILQVSNDGGFTWGNERSISIGQLGQYSTLVRWRRLGRSMNRAFRVIISEPVFVALLAADIDAHE